MARRALDAAPERTAEPRDRGFPAVSARVAPPRCQRGSGSGVPPGLPRQRGGGRSPGELPRDKGRVPGPECGAAAGREWHLLLPAPAPAPVPGGCGERSPQGPVGTARLQAALWAERPAKRPAVPAARPR